MTQPLESHVVANGLRLRYRDSPGSREPIVLLHGLASNARIWDLVAPGLAQEWRVIALNQRSHGGSDGPEEGYSFEDVTSDLSLVLDALDVDRAVVVGHSWGANVAVEFAIRYPGRVAGLGMIDGGIFDLSTNMSWEDAERTMAPPKLAGTPRTRFLEMAKRFELGGQWTPEVEAAVMGNFELREDDTIAPWLSFERHMMILRAIYSYHPAELLPQVRCPALIMPCVRETDAAMAQRKRDAVARVAPLLKDARTVWFEDSIHDVPLQRPDLVARTIAEFARDVHGRPAG
jgi:pimeloyl-ACP methyl ester carboxylesterase